MNPWFRDHVIIPRNKKRFKGTNNITLLCNNCLGGVIFHELGELCQNLLAHRRVRLSLFIAVGTAKVASHRWRNGKGQSSIRKARGATLQPDLPKLVPLLID